MLQRRAFTNVAALGGVAAKTYADFQAHIATLATGGVIGNSSAISTSGRFRTTAANNGSFKGSPWSGTSGYNGFGDAVGPMLIRHCVPSETVWNTLIGLEVYFQVNEVGPAGETFSSAARNGYTSVSGTASGGQFVCLDVIYWDGTGAQRMIPFTSTGPTPYTW